MSEQQWPSHGGSYIREKDGSLRAVEGGPPAEEAADKETPAQARADRIPAKHKTGK